MIIIKLSNKQFKCLDECLSEHQNLKLRLQINKEKKFININLDEDTMDEIRDLIGIELQRKGFDVNYELTSECVILEELVDLFYLE